MLKGFNRRIVVMKNTGSDIFDEAFFLVKENKARQGKSAVNEAKRIIREMEPDRRDKRKIGSVITFLAGCVAGFALSFFF